MCKEEHVNVNTLDVQKCMILYIQYMHTSVSHCTVYLCSDSTCTHTTPMLRIPQSPIKTHVPSLPLLTSAHTHTLLEMHLDPHKGTRHMLRCCTHTFNIPYTHHQSFSSFTVPASPLPHTSKFSYSPHHPYCMWPQNSVYACHPNVHPLFLPPTPPHPLCPPLDPAVWGTQNPQGYRLTFSQWHHKLVNSPGLTCGAPRSHADLHTAAELQIITGWHPFQLSQMKNHRLRLVTHMEKTATCLHKCLVCQILWYNHILIIL